MIGKSLPRVTRLVKSTPRCASFHDRCITSRMMSSNTLPAHGGEEFDYHNDDIEEDLRKRASTQQVIGNDRTRSRVQEQAAAQKLVAMTQFLRFLSRSSSWSSSSQGRQNNLSIASLNQAVLYWLSKATRNVLERQDGDRIQWAAQNAWSIVQWTQRHRPPHELSRVADLPTLTRLQRQLMSVSRNSPVSMQLEGLVQATQVWNLMKTEYDRNRIRTPSNQQDIDESECCWQALTLLWNRRIQFLTRNQNRNHTWIDDKRVTTALGGKTSAHECLDELQYLAQQLEENSLTNPFVYLSLLSSYAHLGAGSEAHQVLNNLEQEASSSKVTIQHYNAVIMAYSNRAVSPDVTEEVRVECVKAALQLWQDQIRSNPHLDHYHPVTMSLLLNLLARTDAQQEAENLLESIPNPNKIHYNILLTALAKNSTTFGDPSSEAPQRALQVLQRMQSRQVTPDRISYTAVMEALLRSNELSALDTVEELLRQCCATVETHSDNTSSSNVKSNQNSSDVGPDIGMYLVILRGLLNFHRRHVESQVKEDVCYRMEKVLDQMLQSAANNTIPMANVETFKLVLNAWSTSHSPLSSSRSVMLLEKMEHYDIFPDSEALEQVFRCLSVKVVDPVWTSEQSSAVFGRIEQYNLTETTEIMQQYLRVLARTGNVEMAHQLVRNRPTLLDDEGSYFSIVEGYAKLPNGAEQADKLLQQWTGTPSLRMHAVVMTAWVHQQDDEEYASERIDDLWNRARRISGNQVPSYFYGTYMKAISKRQNAPQIVEQLLTTMQQEYECGVGRAKPNASNFAIVITSWAESRQPGAAQRAEAILDRLEELYRHDVELKPTLACYRGAIVAWAMSDDIESCGDRAVAILNRLNQHPGLQPNRTCFNYAIKAVGKSKDSDKARKAYELLQRMKKSYSSGNRYAQPSAAEYSSTLRAIGCTSGTTEKRFRAYQLAEKVLSDWCAAYSTADSEAHSQVFLQVLWAAFKLLNASGSRDAIVKEALTRCPLELLLQPGMRQAICKVISRTTYNEVVELLSKRSNLI